MSESERERERATIALALGHVTPCVVFSSLSLASSLSPSSLILVGTVAYTLTRATCREKSQQLGYRGESDSRALPGDRCDAPALLPRVRVYVCVRVLSRIGRDARFFCHILTRYTPRGRKGLQQQAATAYRYIVALEGNFMPAWCEARREREREVNDEFLYDLSEVQ